MASGVALLIMVGLGVWQVRRAAWKGALLAEIAAAEARPGVPLPEAPGQFLKVRVSGTLRGDLAALYGVQGRTIGGEPTLGAQLLVPLERAAGPPVLVMLGWVKVPRDPALNATLAGLAVTIEGYVRVPEHDGAFSAKNDVPGRWFHSLDPVVIGAGLGLREVAPFVVVALKRGAGDAVPAEQLPRPTDNHMQYAITWFGLALTLVGVLVAFLIKGRRA